MQPVTEIKKIAQYIPLKIRRVIYSVIGAAVGLEAIFDWVDPGTESKFLQAIIVLGFGVALGNTGEPVAKSKEEEDPDAV